MRNKSILIFIILALGAFLALPALAAEKIDNFEVEIKINADSSIEVIEQIDYNFGSAQRHGIYRDIPYQYKRGKLNYKLRISDIKVTDESGQKYKFSISHSGGYLKIKIGDEHYFVSEQKTYRISYKVSRAINYFNNHDELYWNATGNEWDVAIENSSVSVSLPERAPADKVQASCFAGALGSNEKCSGLIGPIYDYGARDGTARKIIFTQESLAPNEGLTIVVGWPKNIVSKPPKIQSILYFLQDNWAFLIPIVVFIIMFYVWRKRGRDPRGRGTIVAQYEPPDNLTPAELGTIIDESVDPRDISAEIVHLAIKGYLKIIYLEKQGWLKPKDYELQKLKEPDDLVNEFDKKIMGALFSSNDVVKLSELKHKFHEELAEITKSVYGSTVEKEYFSKNSQKRKKRYILLGIAFMNLIIVVYLIFSHISSIQSFLAIIVSGFIVVLFGSQMLARTEKGVAAKEHILGLKEYLSVAEKDRIKFHNAPEKKPEHFEVLLPYAMVLGVEKEWAKQFEGIYLKEPDWYAGPSGRMFSAWVLASDLGNFHSVASASLGARTSAASGGSGFGGGGFSGGGFGGGGGGSW